MKAARWTLAVAALALAGEFALAAGVNDIFDLNRDGTQGIIQDLQDDKASFTASADLAKIDASASAFQAAPSTGVTASVSAFSTALKKLGKLSTNAAVAPDLQKAASTLYFQVSGYNAQGGAAASGYFATKPTSIKNAAALFKVVKAVTGRSTKIDATQTTNASWTPAKKIALFLSAAKASDALIKKYGGH